MQRIPSIYVAPSTIAGRGVFTYESIEAETLLEICPVIVLPPNELEVIHKTKLHDYYFLWGLDQKEAAIALGFGSIYNHSKTPNARYMMDFEQLTMDFFALRTIEAGEEIFVDYAEDSPNHPLWF